LDFDQLRNKTGKIKSKREGKVSGMGKYPVQDGQGFGDWLGEIRERGRKKRHHSWGAQARRGKKRE